jgi:glutamyl-Q tRNA(Asp) synthetase
MSHTASSILYIGRFAPSPSGPLHFGSLVTALASYLDAKHHHGQWLVRIEDIDPPREISGAKEMILSSLLAHGLQWDGGTMHQSERSHTYRHHLRQLTPYTYPCFCNRQRIKHLQGVYDGYCLPTKNAFNNEGSEHSQTPRSSTRLRIDSLCAQQQQHCENFQDLFQGQQKQPLATESGDFIVHRKDGLFAYQLAVVADDIAQGITHVIRGSDLLSSTARQRYLWKLMTDKQLIDKPLSDDNSIKETRKSIKATKMALPTYGHLPVATTGDGQKLSKQNQATALDDAHAFNNICRALAFLSHPAPTDLVASNDIPALLYWAISRWDRTAVPRTHAIAVTE